MDEVHFDRELANIMTEFTGPSNAQKFLAKGEKAFLIADSFIDVDDQAEFWKKLHEIFNIKSPWVDDPKPTAMIERLIRAFFPRFIYELPDITVGDLRRLATEGSWPEGAVKKIRNPKF